MVTHNRSGSGSAFVRIDFGPIGELVIRDDGYDDTDIEVVIIDPDGKEHGFIDGLASFRYERGDVPFEAALRNGAERHVETQAKAASNRRGSFVCDQCGKTWAQKRNQTPHISTDVCPDCI